MDNIEKLNRGISGSTLKIIAIVTMLIDHIGATIVQGELYAMSFDYTTMRSIYFLGLTMRIIGRLAFPIFCYLLVEGYFHTKNIKKYAIRLFIFALISEIPFDYAFFKTFFYWQHQNVFFTLFLGILIMYGIDFIRNKFKHRNVVSLLCYVVIIIGIIVAELIKCDYSALGILVILFLYFFRDKRSIGAFLVCSIFVANSVIPAIATYNQLNSYILIDTYQFVYYMLISIVQVFACLAFIPLHFYNGKKGISLKYFFYAFYPVHLLLLGLIVNYLM